MLTTYNPQFDYSALDRADLAASSRVKYRRAIELLIQAQVNPLDYASLQSYTDTLSNSGRAFLKAALKVVTDQELNRIKANATPENMTAIQALIARIEAMDATIKVHKPEGKGSGLWLTPAQVEQITTAPDRTTLQGRRDWIVLATILGAGLRRSEMASLTFDQLKRQPKKNGQLRGVLDIVGKGDKKRRIPISPLLEERLKEWNAETGGGNVARSINKAGALGLSLSDNSINDIVHRYGALIGLPELEAHDLRRTWAQLGLNAGIPITQISTLLGHASIKTTQDYLDLKINLESTISDFVPLGGD